MNREGKVVGSQVTESLARAGRSRGNQAPDPPSQRHHDRPLAREAILAANNSSSRIGL
jgi:hypothetical protein